MIDDFFESEEEELDDIEEYELVSQYESMVKNNQSMYLSSDDYESLFTHYTKFYYEQYNFEEVNLEMAGSVINSAIAQYPNVKLLQMFYIYYRHLNKELTLKETVNKLKNITFPEYEKDEQRYYLANIYAKIDAVPQAISLYRELLKEADTEEEKMNIYSGLIFLFSEKEEIIEIVEYCEKLSTTDPKREKATLWHLFIHFFAKIDFGILFFELYTQRNPFSLSGWMYLGESYTVMALYEKAVEAFDNAVAISDNASTLISLGGVYNVLDKKEKALEYYQEVLSRFPERTDVYIDLADTYFSLDQVEVALRYYSMAIEASPEEVHPLIGMAIALASIGQYNEAIAYLERAPKTGFMAIDTLLLLAEYMVEVERDDEAVEIFEQLLELHPSIVDIWLSYSNYYAIIGNFNKACTLIQQGLKALPGNPELMYRMANYYILDGKNERAISFLMTAYMIDSTCLDMFLAYDEDLMKNPLIIDVVNNLKSKN